MSKRTRMQPSRGVGILTALDLPGAVSATVISTEPVDREAGIIRGASAMQAVEALGHGSTADAKTLAQVVSLGNAAPHGIKVRFTHPGLCADGMGKMLGRMRNFRVEGDKAIGDIYLNAVSASSPDGDLRTYVLDLAAEDPSAFGMSVVISCSSVWQLADGSEVEVHYGEYGQLLPAPEGAVNELPFLRVDQLHACDVVDEPAANRDGLFGAPLAEAFSGTSNELAEQAFAAFDDFRTRHGVTIAAAHSFIARYFAARATQAPAGAKPATEGEQMLTKEKLAELCKANPTHHGVIVEMFAADKSEADILAHLAETDRAVHLAALTAQVNEVKTELAAAKADQVKELATRDARIVELEGKLVASEKKCTDLAKNIPGYKDPGDESAPEVRVVSQADLAEGKVNPADVLAQRVRVSTPSVS